MLQLLANDDVDPYEPSLEAAASSCDAGNWMPLKGDYRSLLVRPVNMHWRFERGDALTTGAGEVANGELVGERAACQQSNTAGGIDDCARAADVAVEFDLPPGAYATMALREAMQMRPPTTSCGHIRFLEDSDG